MRDILDTIIASKHKEVENRKKQLPFNDLKNHVTKTAGKRSLTAALQRSTNLQIIAEFKRKSPSVSNINVTADAVELSKAFENAGAAAISVLTDLPYFGGKMSDLKQVRDAVTMPVLRKDFIVDPYQLWESKAFGADLILLIARSLEKSKLQTLLALARDLDMEVLLEVHDVDDIDKIMDLPDFIGVNNRNLQTFETSIDRSISLAPYLPTEVPWVSESGIHQVQAAHDLHSVGYRLLLMGEHFMNDPVPGQKCASFINQLS
ncbi:MAG: indole-3-glycerol phosphate synthase TrpC [Saprospiraceae bacterium]|nr:indole-3-glycerol phosphate synthase TrpC [Saprospiraceae bacterium]